MKSTFKITLLSFIFAGCTHHQAVPEKKSAPQVQGPAYDAELTNYKYPRDVQFFDFRDQKSDLRMAYVTGEPEKSNGQTVLLLHGKNFSANYWEPTIKLLVAKGFRVIAPDQIGFGKSSKPGTYQYSFHALAKNTKALLDKLQAEKVVVVGHSMGGMLAARFALMYPQVTSKLVLVNPIGLEDWKTLVSYRSVDENFANELKSTPETIKEYQRMSYFGGEWKSEYEPLIDILSGWTRHPDFEKVAWVNALTSDMVFTQPILYEFPKISAPTLLIIGQRDRTAIGRAWAAEPAKSSMGDYPKLGRQSAKSIRGAKLVEIPKVGHMPQIEAFDQYSKALLDFLK